MPAIDPSAPAKGPPAPAKVGLHQRNRDKRANSILVAAAAMFRRKGYDATRIEDIAESAEVSPGTVYSYFETKENILLSMLRLHRESNVQRRLRIVEFPPDDVLEAVIKYERTLLTDATRYLDRELWRRVTAAGVMQTTSRIGERSIQIDRVANEERLKMFAVLAERGVISPHFPIARVAEVIRAVSYHVWVKFLRGELKTLAAAQKNVSENVAFVLRGEGAANERKQRAN